MHMNKTCPLFADEPSRTAYALPDDEGVASDVVGFAESRSVVSFVSDFEVENLFGFLEGLEPPFSLFFSKLLHKPEKCLRLQCEHRFSERHSRPK